MTKPKNSSRRRDRKRDVAIPIHAEDAAVEAKLLPHIRPLADIPERMHRLAAIRQLVADLELARTAYERHDQIGAEAAMQAVLRVCHALGRQDLCPPFRAIYRGIFDVRAGKERPRIFRQGSIRNGRPPKSTVEREITLNACAFLEILVQDASVPADEARSAITAILTKNNIQLGIQGKSSANALKHAREELSRGNCSSNDASYFRQEVIALRRDMAPYPQAERQKLLLGLFEDFLSGYLGIPDKPPFYLHGEGA